MGRNRRITSLTKTNGYSSTSSAPLHGNAAHGIEHANNTHPWKLIDSLEIYNEQKCLKLSVALKTNSLAQVLQRAKLLIFCGTIPHLYSRLLKDMV